MKSLVLLLIVLFTSGAWAAATVEAVEQLRGEEHVVGVGVLVSAIGGTAVLMFSAAVILVNIRRDIRDIRIVLHGLPCHRYPSCDNEKDE